MANRIIYIVRHGQYLVTTPEGEEPDGRLTNLGQEQANLTGQRLKNFAISTIHHSTLQRATETAEIIATHLPDARLKPTPILRECIPCVPQGFESYFEQVPDEALAHGREKSQHAFNTFITPPAKSETDQVDLLVSHGNLISALIALTLNAPLDSWILTDIQHTGISQIVSTPQGWLRLLRHNDVGHLPTHLQTFL